MTRKSFLLALTCLGLVEAGLLLTGFLGRHRPDRGTTPPAIGLPDPSLPQALAIPTLFTEPAAGFTWIDDLVRNARGTLDLTMYELADTTFSGLLVQACQRGVAVRVILDGNRERAANTPAYNQLSAAGPHCQVAWSNPQFPATHQKTLLVDGNRAVVMSFNLTSRFYADTRDFALIDTDTADVGAIQWAFNKDFNSTSDGDFQPNAGHNLIWSPTTAQDDLVSLINGAGHTLLVENEELSAPPIVTALAAACRRGVQLSLAMTDTSAAYHANFTALQNAGCGVHIGPNNDQALYLHAKAMVADLGTPAAIGYVGSINFSTASMTANRELGLYVHDPSLLANLAGTLSADFNQFPAWNPAAASANLAPARP